MDVEEGQEQKQEQEQEQKREEESSKEEGSDEELSPKGPWTLAAWAYKSFSYSFSSG